jgi:TPR repeat protein
MTFWPRSLLLVTLFLGLAAPVSAQAVPADADPAVQTRRALALIAGDGVRQDVTTGLHLLRGAAEKAHPPALRLLGDVFASGTLVRRDDGFALALYRAAAERGDAEAQRQLARRYLALLFYMRRLF